MLSVAVGGVHVTAAVVWPAATVCVMSVGQLAITGFVVSAPPAVKLVVSDAETCIGVNYHTTLKNNNVTEHLGYM